MRFLNFNFHIAFTHPHNINTDVHIIAHLHYYYLTVCSNNFHYYFPYTPIKLSLQVNFPMKLSLQLHTFNLFFYQISEI